MNHYTHYKIWIVLTLILFSTTVPVVAQDTGCPIDVQLALQQSQEFCVEIGSDRVCYGNWEVSAQPQAQVQQFVFAAPGDLERVSGIRSLSLSAMDAATGAWGIAHMRLLVTSASLEPADVRLVLFGDVGIDNLVESREMIPVTVNTRAYINVRQYPNANGAIVATLAPQAEVTAVGRLADASWFRILTEENVMGWVMASLLTPAGDSNTLTIDTSGAPYYSPMQSFLYSSTDSGSCSSASGDGMLIQTPEGQARVSFLINEVSIDLASSQTGSTAFMQAQADGDMAITMLDGSVTVTAQGTQYRAIAGSQISVPLGSDLVANGPPGMPQPYDTTLVHGLADMGLLNLDPPPPATQDMILAANGYGGNTIQNQNQNQHQTQAGNTYQNTGNQPGNTGVNQPGNPGGNPGEGPPPTTEPGVDPPPPTDPPPPPPTPCPGQSCDCHGKNPNCP